MKKLTQLKAVLLALIFMLGCNSKPSEKETDKPEEMKTAETPFVWEAANVYFLLTDRFYNGKKDNDVNFERTKETGKLRGFMGGDIAGITKKLKEGYFEDLGINALWFTPVFEQVKGATNEGTGNTYAFHGYWPRDWTALDPNFGTFEELAELVEEARKRKIRILLDVIVNHIGPVTDEDPVWPSDWVRTDPQCGFTNYDNTITCTLVKNLPDIKTESEENVELPPFLVEKWKVEGRYEQEIAELDAFFERTGYPRAPKYYIIKWLSDYVRELGVDGFRFDTVKHIEEDVCKEVKKEMLVAFKDWKKANPDKVLDDNEFFMVGEVYGYGLDGKNIYNFGDREVDYFKNGFNSLINFQFLHDAKRNTYEGLFAKYDTALKSKEMTGNAILNYLSSHDDHGPFDPKREKAFESATKLLLSPGAAQVYYGDETARSLVIEGAEGDATLRSFMNWEDLESDAEVNGVPVRAIHEHWQKLGKFRKDHPAIGAGKHKMISETPYVFMRTYTNGKFSEKVVVGLDIDEMTKEIPVKGAFKDGDMVIDAYSGKPATVKDGKVMIETDFMTVLLEKAE